MNYYIQDFCSICLSISNEKWSEKFSKYPDNLTPFDKIQTVFQTLSAVMDSDSRICLKCCDKIDSMYEFHKSCLKNINTLSSYKDILKESKMKKRCDLSIDLSERKQLTEIPITFVEIKVEPVDSPLNDDDMLGDNDLISESHLNGAAEVKEEIELNYKESETSWLDSEEQTKGVDMGKVWTDEIKEKREDESLKSNSKDYENISVQFNEEVFIKEEENVDCLQEVAEEHSIETAEQNESSIQKQTIHNDAKQFDCVECGKTLSSELDLESHMLSHSNIQTFATIKYHPCDICGKLFYQKQQLKLHILKHTGEKPYKCNLCDKLFNDPSSLSRHKFLHTGEKPYKCELCERSFNDPSSLSRHKFLHTGEKPFKCDICEKLFAQNGTLKKHMLIHTGEKPYKCDICEKLFTYKSDLKRHNFQHTGVKPKCNIGQYKCNICEKPFSNPRSLTRHKFVHTGEKPHKCNICGNAFTRKEILKQHILTHTGEKPYKCETCEKSFRQKATLEAHMLIHTGEKSYKCDICGKLFAQKRSFIYHSSKHHEKPQKS